MFGWEFPPFNSGGLGTACYGLARALSHQSVQVTFVLPKKIDVAASFMKLVFADVDDVPADLLTAFFSGYISPSEYEGKLSQIRNYPFLGSLFAEVGRYAKKAAEIARREQFDIIHAHDWLSFPAGIAAKKVSKKPFVAHVHATEFDRTCNGSINSQVHEIERAGMQTADRVIVVSNYTKQMILENYGIQRDKISVIHNAINADQYPSHQGAKHMKERFGKIVLFVGRLTLQKGPDYFIRVAKRVLEVDPKVFFILAGSGDMGPQVIQEVATYGISDRVLFAGFLRGKELEEMYQAADIFVLPSVSEPFGLTPLEALANGTPVLLSKQSGVSEVIHNVLKVDFWDIEEMANKILSVLAYKPLYTVLKNEGLREVRTLSWENSARQCIGVYREVLRN